MTHDFSFLSGPMMSPPDADGPAGFTTQWHGHGSGHQDNNAPGDTAADRHNFGDAPAGKSGHNPTQGSEQDDFSEETGLPFVQVKDLPFDADEFPGQGDNDMLDMI